MFITNYTIVDGTTVTGLYAADGSYNVVDSSEETGPTGLYHPCGAYWVTFVAADPEKAYAPNGSFYALDASP